MSEANPPAGAESQQTQAEAETQQTPPAAASGATRPDIKERLARQERKLRGEAEAAIARAREEAVSEFREEHGIDDDALTQWQQRDKAATENRTLKSQATRSANEAAQWKAKFEAAFGHLDQTLRADAIMREAVSQGSNDPEVVVALLRPSTKLIEQEGKYSVAVVDDRGEVTEGSIREAVETLLAKKPHLVASTSRAEGAGSRLSQHRTSDGANQFGTREQRLAHLQKSLGG